MCRSASVITEYVDVAHAFYDKRESGFVNGLLDAIAKEARPARAELMREREVIARLRRIATAPEARGLTDDVALLDGLVITHDSIAEGVHYLPSDPPASVGWKLVAVNLSDLAPRAPNPARRVAVADHFRRRRMGGWHSSAELKRRAKATACR